MKKIFLSVTFTFLAMNSILAQFNAGRLIFKMAPLSLADPNTPSLQLGLEFKPLKKFGIQGDVGFKMDETAVFNWNQYKEDHRFQKIRAELRFYFSDNFINPFYTAIEGFSVSQDYIKRDSWIQRGEEQIKFDHSEVSSQIKGGNIKIGAQVKFPLRLVFDAYTGAGVRFIEISHKIQNPTTVTNGELRDEWLAPRDRKEGSFIVPNLTLGFKLGYKIL